jgi:hypothetical protein
LIDTVLVDQRFVSTPMPTGGDINDPFSPIAAWPLAEQFSLYLHGRADSL